MTTFGIEELPNERIQLLVRTSAHIDVVLKGKNDTTRRLTLASIWHGIHFIPPPGDIKKSLNDSADSSTDHGRKTLKLSRFRCKYRPPSPIGFRCRFVAASVLYRKNFPFFNPRRNPCLLIEQNSNHGEDLNGVLTFLLSIFVSFGHPVSIQLCDAASAICSLQ